MDSTPKNDRPVAGRSTRKTDAASTEPLLLGLDIGSSQTKAVLVDRAGEEVVDAAVPTPFESRGEAVEMEVDALLQSVATVLRDLGEARAHVAAAGLVGMAESGAPLDERRRPLAPVIAWHDTRGEEAVARLEQHFDGQLSLRIGQPVRTVLTAAKLGWLVDHGLEGADRWLGVPELVLHALTGAEAIEYSQAARTGCYDVAAKEWMPEVAAVLGFSVDLFAPVQPAGATMGRTSERGARWSGLPEGIPVTVGGHDHLAGMAGAGVAPGELANSVGTAETIVARSPTVPDVGRALELRAAVTVYPGGEHWAALVSAARAGIVLTRAADALGHSLEELDRLSAATTPVGVGDDAVDAIAHGTRPPSEVLPDGSPGDIWAGLLRALVQRTVEGATRLVSLVGDPRRVVTFGGGSVSRPWLQAKAAALPWPLWRAGTISAVARGAALHAGVAAGWWSSADEAPRPVADRID